jgi:hypothetical protein
MCCTDAEFALITQMPSAPAFAKVTEAVTAVDGRCDGGLFRLRRNQY